MKALRQKYILFYDQSDVVRFGQSNILKGSRNKCLKCKKNSLFKFKPLTISGKFSRMKFKQSSTRGE